MTSSKILTKEPIEYSKCIRFIPLVEGSVVYVPRVYDGDTVTLAYKHPYSSEFVRISCRLKGIDTPEIRGTSDAEKELAKKAKQRLCNAVLGKFVTVQDTGVEKYGRVLCNLKTDNIESVSAYMLEDSLICRPYTGGKKESWVKSEL